MPGHSPVRSNGLALSCAACVVHDIHRLLECAGCGSIFYQHVTMCSDDEVDGIAPTITHFPPLSKRPRASWLSSAVMFGEERDVLPSEACPVTRPGTLGHLI